MPDHYTFKHGPLRVEGLVNDNGSELIDVYLGSGGIWPLYCAWVRDDIAKEAADLFKAFKAVYEAGVGDGEARYGAV